MHRESLLCWFLWRIHCKNFFFRIFLFFSFKMMDRRHFLTTRYRPVLVGTRLAIDSWTRFQSGGSASDCSDFLEPFADWRFSSTWRWRVGRLVFRHGRWWWERKEPTTIKRKVKRSDGFWWWGGRWGLATVAFDEITGYKSRGENNFLEADRLHAWTRRDSGSSTLDTHTHLDNERWRETENTTLCRYIWLPQCL